MTLKKQFINTINLIKSGTSNEKEWDIIENETLYSCNKINFSRCDNCLCEDCKDVELENGKCKHLETCPIDLCVCNPAEDIYFNICFNSRPANDNQLQNIWYVNRSKSLYDTLDLIKFEMYRYDYDKIRYAKNSKILINYAREFAKSLHKMFLLLEADNIPLVLHSGSRGYTESEFVIGGQASGTYNSVIDIYYVNDSNIEALKKTCRHELIHHALQISGFESADDSVVFHLLCDRYDAGAYKPLSEDNQKIFNKNKKMLEWIQNNKTFTAEEKTIQENAIILETGVNDISSKRLTDIYNIKKGIVDNSNNQVIQNMKEQIFFMLT